MKPIVFLAIMALATTNVLFAMAPSPFESAEWVLSLRYAHTAQKLLAIETLNTPASKNAVRDFNLSVQDPNYLVVDPKSVELLAELLAPNQKVCPVTCALLIAHPLK